MMLRSLRVLVQGASLLNGLEFDPLTFFQDSLAGPEIDVARGQIVQALMVVCTEYSIQHGRREQTG